MINNNKIELLAPGGDVDSVKAAIAAGADAVYCGLNRFNARNRAANIDFDELNGILILAHKNNCKVFLTLNIIIVGSEIPALITLLNRIVNTSIDGVIIQDFGLFYLLSRYFKNLKIHASTQLTTHNEGQIYFLHRLNATRVNLSRELNIDEIRALTLAGHKKNISAEVFVHGSYCISFSGICYISSVHGGNSGNRGRCSQPCRDRFMTTPVNKNFPLNLKDNSAFFDLEKISAAGVDSIKIEGRIKKFDYVFTTVNCWKKQLEALYKQNPLSSDNSDLYKVFNRDFSNSYLTGDINKNMFIDNPKDHSIKQFSEISDSSADETLKEEKEAYYEKKAELSTNAKNKISELSISKIPLKIRVSGSLNNTLKISLTAQNFSFIESSETDLKSVDTNNQVKTKSLNYNTLLQRLNPINNTGYFIDSLDTENLDDNLFLSFKDFTVIKKRILSALSGAKVIQDPVDVPFLTKQPPLSKKPNLSVLISSQKDLQLCETTSADIFFQLPNNWKNSLQEFTNLFLKNRKLIPWFPSVLIGENYNLAVEFLEKLKPEIIVTNNTGIAFEAFNKGISWIAGPYLNIVNSFSLLCLKENFGCNGAYISNEINRIQIKSIIRPKNFKLYYSIFHPILLLSGRQCLFHQVTGCEKSSVDEECVLNCKKSVSITNLKNNRFFITKTKGDYHCLYNNQNFLNTKIITDLPGMFSGFSIDLRDIKTETTTELDKPEIIRLFENLLNGNPDAKNRLEQQIHSSTNTQYKKGI